MSDSGPTNENQGVEDFFARQKDAQAAGDSEERKQWYVEEFQRREEKTRRRTRPWRYLGNTVLVLLAFHFLLAPWEREFAHLNMMSFLFVPFLLSVVWLVAVVGFMVTRKLKCPKCHREISKLVKNLCPHCAARLRPEGVLQFGSGRRWVRPLAVFVMIALVGASWFGAGMHRERRLQREQQLERERQLKQPLLVRLYHGELMFRKLSAEMDLPGHSLYAAFQVRRAYVECWILVEADGEEIAKTDVLRIDQTSFSDANSEVENVTVSIFCTQSPKPDVRLTQSGLDHSFSYGLVLLGEHGNSNVRAGPTAVTVNFGVMPTSTPSFRVSGEPTATGLPDEPTQHFTVYAESRTGQIVDPDNEKQLKERKITYRVMCRLVQGEGLPEQ